MNVSVKCCPTRTRTTVSVNCDAMRDFFCVVPAGRIVLQDTTIIHDRTHPDYSESRETEQLRILTASISSGGGGGATGGASSQDPDNALFSPVSDTSYGPVFSDDEGSLFSPKRRMEDDSVSVDSPVPSSEFE